MRIIPAIDVIVTRAMVDIAQDADVSEVIEAVADAACRAGKDDYAAILRDIYSMNDNVAGLIAHYAKRCETDKEVSQVDQTANAIRDAYTLGQQQATADYDAQIEAINQINEQRMHYTMPAAVAGMMEQAGVAELSLDLGAVATVFKRCAVDYRLEEVDGNAIITYKLVKLDADKAPA